MDSPLVSIIVPNYNHYNYLQQRLDSIFNQSFQDFEVILLDDASTDESLKILNRFKSDAKVSNFVINETNSGSPFKQWIKGIELAKGEYIWIAESDDYAEEYFLEKIIEVFRSSQSVDVVFSGIRNVDHNNMDIGNASRIERKYSNLLENDFTMSGKEFLKVLLPDYCLIRNVSCSVFKKSIIGYKTKKIIEFKTIGDLYFWIQLAMEGYNFSYLSEKLNYMRSHSQTVRSSLEKRDFKKKELKKIHNVILRSKYYDLKINRILAEYWLKKI